jgi:hypothetical protein
MINERFYRFLRFCAQIGLPFAGSIYFALSQIQGADSGEVVIGTIVVADLVLGVFLSLAHSTVKYDGQIIVYDHPDGTIKTYSLELESDPEELDSKKHVVFKVNPVESFD